MVFSHTVAILGGDTRQLSLAAKLAEEGLTVRAFGLPRESLPPRVECFLDWKEALGGATVVLLPLPASPDGIHVNLPLATGQDRPTLSDIFSLLPPGALLSGGKLTPSTKAALEEQGIRYFDYFDSEELQERNALPTAEGAVSILMREIPRTVKGLSVGVTGYGRVARALTELLLAMGAEVTVAARKRSDIAAAAALGCYTVHLTGGDSLAEIGKRNRVIFNTVPYWIFSKSILSRMHRESLIIDLASAPGGVDATAAEAQGIRVIWALSLPGKYAPATAGEIIAQTLLSYLQKEGTL